MVTKFLCLTNSFKEGGRCVAGIELDKDNSPVMINGRPKWIRPICTTTPHGEVPNSIAESFPVLKIVEIEIIKPQPQGYQSENVIFNEKSIRVTGNYTAGQLTDFCDDADLIFGNRGKAVSQEFIGTLDHSLLLVPVTVFRVIQRTYEDNPEKPQTRFAFAYKRNQYDFPITDAYFLHLYQHNLNAFKYTNQVYLVLSLSVEWQGWYYKLVAGIIQP